MQGQLFTQDFLLRGVRDTPPCQEFSEESFAAFRKALATIYTACSSASVINEASTEQDIIAPVPVELGWGADTLPQQNLSGKRREDVPDTLLFVDTKAKARAQAEAQESRRYRHGIAILEAKRWSRPLDRGCH
jgi:hypothetical protein